MNFVSILKFEQILNKLNTKIITLFSGYNTVYRNKSYTSIIVHLIISLTVCAACFSLALLWYATYIL